MADKKISALTASATPLAGTEVLPIVQSGSTVKVAVSNLTAGRSVGMQQANIAAAAGGGFANPAFIADDGTGAARIVFLGAPYAGVPANKPWLHSYQDIYVGSDAGTTFNVISGGTKTLGVDGSGNATVTGNFVIGTTAKGITTGSAIPLGFGVNNTVTAITIDTSSNVGVGTTSPLTGAMTNNGVLNAGLFATVRGSAASTSGAAVTIAVANQNHAQATYIVSVGISSGAPAAYSAVAIVSADNNTLRATTLQTASLMTISVSGTDIQATQTSGGAATILYTLTRVA